VEEGRREIAVNTFEVREMLATIREDHDLVAEQLRILEELEHSVIDPESRHLDRALELLRGASRFFQAKLLPHLDEEEGEMFRLFRERLPRGSTLIYELEAEHEQMRKLCEQLREELVWVRHEKYRRPAVISHLRDLCVRITTLLTQHARQEESLLEHFKKGESHVYRTNLST
jgi:hemerythrin-like domain-containing protein